MARTVGIGHQDFDQLISNDNFYIDKTPFIKEWWENQDIVTLITRPRRFGKTLNLNMTEYFFSEVSFHNMRKMICQIITNLYNQYDFLLDSGLLNEKEKNQYQNISADMEDYLASTSLHMLSDYLMRYYGKKVIILLDEYDTPMQEAYVHGYWDELVFFMRSLFNSTFKTTYFLERTLMTGITRVSKESVFSDLNNLVVVTTTSEQYADCFGFTRQEVWAALAEYGLSSARERVQDWYDGFTF